MDELEWEENLVSGEDEFVSESGGEESGPPEVPEEVSGEPEEAPAEPAPEELPGEAETPPAEEPVEGSETVKDLIDAIGNLNETITGAVSQEPEELPAEGDGSGSGGGGEIVVEETGGTVDLTPVVRVLERNEKLLNHTNELLEQQSEVLATQHNDLLQLQANVNFVFLAVAALIGVVLGVAVGKVFHDLWRA